MAEALTEYEILEIIAKWSFSFYQAYEGMSEVDTKSGLRDKPLISCQYWIKGLPGVCKYWDESTSSCKYSGVPKPSGYNGGKCDFLGRRSECNRYSSDSPSSEFMCAAPNPFVSGLYKILVPKKVFTNTDGSTYTAQVAKEILIAVSKSEIRGYCGGKCDGKGTGTGCADESSSGRVVCQYYRPWQMGFGNATPHELARDSNGYITPEALADAYNKIYMTMKRRLPFSFHIFNMRARFQKCIHWDEDYGSKFFINTTGFIELDTEIDDEGRLKSCKKINDSAAALYATLVDNGDSQNSFSWPLSNIWAKAETVICNGAKPECPCYSGKWIYCVDAQMANGMRITAEQVMELRFWTADWASQEEYDAFYTQKPNFDDVETASIYTYDKIIVGLSQDSKEEVAMTGREVKMCQPAPINMREFIPEAYLADSHAITFATLGKEEGTSAPKEDQIFFPSLVRNLDAETQIVNPLTVTYPYFSREPFKEEPCDNEAEKRPICIKPTYDPYLNKVMVFGHTVRNRDVYVINMNFIDIPKFLGDHLKKRGLNLLSLPPKDRIIIYNEVASWISQLKSMNTEGFYEESSNITGFFMVGPVKLEHHERNELLILVDFRDDGMWDFRVRSVLSQVYGGIIYQKDFLHQYSSENENGHKNTLPKSFTPEATSKLVTFPVLTPGEDADVPYPSRCYPITEQSYYNREFSLIREYNYSIQEKKELDKKIERWTSVGDSEYILADIEDTDLNYLFDWEIISASIINKAMKEEREKAESSADPKDELKAAKPKCDDLEENIDLEVVFPTNKSERMCIPPGAVLLKPKEEKLFVFHNNDWELTLSYKYNILENSASSGDNTLVFPIEFNEVVKFVPNKFNVNFSTNGGIEVSGIKDQTVGLLVPIADFEGRMQAMASTKVMAQISELKCRNVDINYRYSSPAVHYKIMPYGGNMTSMGGAAAYKLGTHSYAPPCGDHGTNFRGYGYIWYPFDTCDQIDYYFVYCGAGSCLNPFPPFKVAVYDPLNRSNEGTGYFRPDYRFCCPPRYVPYAEDNGVWLAVCAAKWKYSYSKCGIPPGGVDFSGSGFIRTRVNGIEYAVEDWTTPPFGNTGREMVTRFISQDYLKHLSQKDSEEYYLTGDWTPLVMDNKIFAFWFNPIERGTEDFYFGFNCQLNNLMANFISEMCPSTVEEIDASIGKSKDIPNRYRFDDVISINREPFCFYPTPLLTKGSISSSFYVVFYNFIHENTAWVWQEVWRDIERGQEASIPETSAGNIKSITGTDLIDQLNNAALIFVKLFKPDYIWSYDKEEHRLISEEGKTTINFKPPVFDKKARVLKKLPSIQIINSKGEGPDRSFEIRYSDYTNKVLTTDWDDADDGEIDGSGGKPNIYSKVKSDDWLHDPNTIFEGGASSNFEVAEDSNKKVLMAYDDGIPIYKYYNRGLIFNIFISSLKYMPTTNFTKSCVPTCNILAASDIPFPNNKEAPSYGIFFINEKAEGNSIRFTFDFSTNDGGIDPDYLSFVELDGNWGHHRAPVGDGSYKDYYACIPDLQVFIAYEGGDSGQVHVPPSDADEVLNITGYPFEEHYSTIAPGEKSKSDITRYNISRYMPGTPADIMFKKTSKVTVVLTPKQFESTGVGAVESSSTDNQLVVINNIKLFFADWSSKSEEVFVWERKYAKSFGSINSPNPDGMEHVIAFETDMNMSGQYFQFANPLFKNKISTFNKLRQIYADPYYDEDEKLELNMGNLVEKEQEEQKKLYDVAYSLDLLGFKANYYGFLGLTMAQSLPSGNDYDGNCDFTGETISFEDTEEFKRYYNYSFWQPQGHKFEFGETAFKARCWLWGTPVETVYTIDFIHMDTNEKKEVGELSPAEEYYGGRALFQCKAASGDYILDGDTTTIAPKSAVIDPRDTLSLGPAKGFGF